MGIKEIVSGNELENDLDLAFYCFSSKATDALSSVKGAVRYTSYLNNLSKVEAVRSLHELYPEIAEFQYSCGRNENQRWCLRCEKCFRTYAIFKSFGFDCSAVGLNEEALHQNIPLLVWKARN